MFQGYMQVVVVCSVAQCWAAGGCWWFWSYCGSGRSTVYDVEMEMCMVHLMVLYPLAPSSSPVARLSWSCRAIGLSTRLS